MGEIPEAQQSPGWVPGTRLGHLLAARVREKFPVPEEGTNTCCGGPALYQGLQSLFHVWALPGTDPKTYSRDQLK